ncbi:M24 family metallopeptidase [Rhodococcus sp. T2V]|uniref:M24 family metallopeptidase n=1 Tax=Rhodococcus sp. T2V TaxID=3034164 RepID=UPI0031FED080
MASTSPNRSGPPVSVTTVSAAKKRGIVRRRRIAHCRGRSPCDDDRLPVLEPTVCARLVRGLIAPCASESQVRDGVRDLADEMFGTRRCWHKRIVRSGGTTLEPYRSNPPDLTIADDDVVFLDFGPIFEGWEAGFGCTCVLGDDRAARRCGAGVAAR